MNTSTRRPSWKILRRTLGLLLPLAILACTDSTGPDPTFWDYGLVTVNGSAPYLSKSQIATEAEQIYDGTISLNADGSWSLGITIFGVASGGTIGPSTPERDILAHGTWTRSGESFTLRDSSDGSTMTAAHGDTNLTVVRGNDVLVFELNCWKSCGHIGF
jgi:hypothetical protein